MRGPFEEMFGKEFVNQFTNKTGRAVHQTEFLFKLVNYNPAKLVELEEKLHNNHCHFCPATEEKLQEVLNMGYGSYWWKMEFVLNTRKPGASLSLRELFNSFAYGKNN